MTRTQWIFRFVFASAIIFFGAMETHAQSVITRQPGPFPEGMDVWYSNVYQNIGVHDKRLTVGGWGDEYDTFIRFDLSGLPQTAISATLQLYSDPPGGTATHTKMLLYKLTNTWDARTVSLSNTPASTKVRSLLSPPTSGWYSIDVTALYNGWRSGISSTLNYGVKLVPTSVNNNFNNFRSSAFDDNAFRPQLVVTYNPLSTDTLIKLKWPLGSVQRVVNNAFATDWTLYSTKCPGITKLHNGTDYQAAVGNLVYAAEDGILREVTRDPNWGYNIVLEHMRSNGTPYTTVYWHVNPLGDAASFWQDPKKQPRFVPKGAHIANVANLGSNTHFHLGIRMGRYEPALSGLGGLPSQAPSGGCVDPTDGITYPQFPAGFLDPEDVTQVLLQ